MVAVAAIPYVAHLPRLCAVLSGVLGVASRDDDIDFDMAEALACDEQDRAEVLVTMDRRFGIALPVAEVEACESVADLLRLVAAQRVSPWHRHA
jgi:acyl carrier protein